MDFNAINRTNTSLQPDSPPPAEITGFEHQLSELQGGTPLHVAGSPVLQGEPYSPHFHAGQQQLIAQHVDDLPGFDPDRIWQDLEAGPSRPAPSPAGPSGAGPSGAGPLSSAEAAMPELGNFVTAARRPISENWVFIGQTAGNDQMNMLRSAGRLPSKDCPITTFSIWGVPHTAEWREEGLIRLNPLLDAKYWPGGTGEDEPARSPRQDMPRSE